MAARIARAHRGTRSGNRAAENATAADVARTSRTVHARSRVSFGATDQLPETTIRTAKTEASVAPRRSSVVTGASGAQHRASAIAATQRAKRATQRRFLTSDFTSARQ